jgi:hypothetical protein
MMDEKKGGEKDQGAVTFARPRMAGPWIPSVALRRTITLEEAKEMYGTQGATPNE